MTVTPISTAKKAPAKRAAKKTTTKALPPAESGQHEVPQLLVLAHDVIDPNPGNVRMEIREDDALQQLADSIDERGLIEPLVVYPGDQSGRYVLLAGHRRLAAAARLKPPPALPCIVRPVPASAADAVADMVVENQHRANLSPVEEARAFEAMALDGLGDNDIALKVGLPRRRVKERRELLGLGEAAQTRLHDGQLTLEQAAALLDFADDPGAVTELEQTLARPDAGGYFGWRETHARLRARREWKVEAAKVKAQLEDQGRTVVDREPDNHLKLGWHAGTPATVEEHDATSCRHLVAHLRGSGMVITSWYCLDPTEHGGQMPGQSDALDEVDQQQREEAAKAAAAARALAEEQCATAAKLRTEHLRGYITGQHALTAEQNAAIAAWYTAMTLLECAGPDGGTASQLLDLDPDDKEVPAWETDQRLAAAVRALPGPVALLVAAASICDDELAYVYRWEENSLGGSQERLSWLSLLGGPLGYEFTEWEAEHLDAARANAEARAAEETAEMDDDAHGREIEDVAVAGDVL